MSLSNAQKAIAVIGVGGAVAAVGYMLVSAAGKQPPSSQTPTTLTLIAASQTEDTGASDVFTATLYDQNGNYIPNYAVTLLDQTTNTTATAKTDSSGKATWTVTFASPGTYDLVASA